MHTHPMCAHILPVTWQKKEFLSEFVSNRILYRFLPFPADLLLLTISCSILFYRMLTTHINNFFAL